MLLILVVVSIFTNICLFRVGITKDLKRTCRFHVKSYGWRHLTGYCVVRILIALRCRNICLVLVDTTVWSCWYYSSDPSDSLGICWHYSLILLILQFWSFWKSWYLLTLQFDPSEGLLNRTWLDCPLICIKYLCFMRIYIGGWLVLERW